MGKADHCTVLPISTGDRIEDGCSAANFDRFEELRGFCIATLRRFDEIAAEHELTSAQWFCLRLLSREGVGNCRKLANHLGYDAGAMTRLLDVLVSRRLVHRQRSETDRRIIELALTADAILVVQDLEKKLADCEPLQP